MSGKTKTTVKIGGREYAMKGFETEEHIHRVANYLDQKMQQVANVQTNLSTTMVTLLTAVNLADEVLKLKEQIKTLKQENETLKEAIKKISLSSE